MLLLPHVSHGETHGRLKPFGSDPPRVNPVIRGAPTIVRPKCWGISLVCGIDIVGRTHSHGTGLVFEVSEDWFLHYAVFQSPSRLAVSTPDSFGHGDYCQTLANMNKLVSSSKPVLPREDTKEHLNRGSGTHYCL